MYILSSLYLLRLKKKTKKQKNVSLHLQEIESVQCCVIFLRGSQESTKNVVVKQLLTKRC